MRSLQQQLSFGIAVAVGALLAFSGLIAYPAVHSLLKEEYDQSLLAKARALTAPATAGASGVSLRFTEYPPPEFQPGPRSEYFQVWSADGALVARSPSFGNEILLRPRVTGDEPRFWNVTLPDGRRGRAVTFNLALDEGADAPRFTLVFARDTLRLRGFLRTVVVAMVVGGVLLLAAAAWLARVVTRAGLRPVTLLSQQVTRIDASSLKTRLKTSDAPPELRPVVEQLNSLLERLHEAFDRERRFSAHVAHELLTPVAELRSLAENAVRWREDREATARLADDVLDSAGQMERQINTLMTLARSERGDLPFRLEAMNLVPILDELRVLVAPRLVAKQLQLEWIVPPAAMVCSDPAACRGILQNLFENAAEHTPTGGRIDCEIVGTGHGMLLTLTNTNPGLGPGDLLRVFEPFWRADIARTDRNHAGLGLALARSLSTALRCRLEVVLTPRNDVRFSFWIPAGNPPNVSLP